MRRSGRVRQRAGLHVCGCTLVAAPVLSFAHSLSPSPHTPTLAQPHTLSHTRSLSLLPQADAPLDISAKVAREPQLLLRLTGSSRPGTSYVMGARLVRRAAPAAVKALMAAPPSLEAALADVVRKVSAARKAPRAVQTNGASLARALRGYVLARCVAACLRAAWLRAPLAFAAAPASARHATRCRPCTPTNCTNRTPHVSRPRLRTQLAGDGDVEVSASAVSLRCPLSCGRIATPARFSGGDALACFDLDAFLEVTRRSGKWQVRWRESARPARGVRASVRLMHNVRCCAC